LYINSLSQYYDIQTQAIFIFNEYLDILNKNYFTWSERITMFGIEVDFKSSEAVVEGTLREVKDWKLH